MVPKFTMREETMGGYLELVDVFEIAFGADPIPHYHDTHEFFFILAGQPVIQIGARHALSRWATWSTCRVTRRTAFGPRHLKVFADSRSRSATKRHMNRGTSTANCLKSKSPASCNNGLFADEV